MEITGKHYDDVTYVSQNVIKINNVTTQGLNIVSETETSFLVTYNNDYYLIKKSGYETRDRKAYKLISTENITNTFNNEYFLINGIWHRITLIDYSNKISNIPTKLSTHFELIYSNQSFSTSALLIKDDQNIYIYDERKNLISTIPELDANATQLIKWNSYYLLFDDDTIYILYSYLAYLDITSTFNAFGKYNGFSHIKPTQYGQFAIDTGDGYLWVRNNSNMSESFTPIQAKFLSSDHELILYKNKVYNDSYVIHQENAINTKEVESIEKLREKNGSYRQFSDGINLYQYDVLNRKFSKIALLETEQDDKPNVNNKITSYGNISINDSFIVINDSLDVKNPIKHNFEYIGSILDIIQRCDDRNTPRALIKTYYFFKDKESVYSYYTGETEIRKIPDANPNDFQNDNYNSLVKLMELDKRSDEERESRKTISNEDLQQNI